MKRLLILTAKTGGGHVSVARSVAAACYDLYSTSLDVRVADPFSGDHQTVFDRAARWYGPLIVRFPELWRALYHSTDNPATFALLRRLSRPVFRERMQALLAERYDMVLSVHPFCHHLVRHFAPTSAPPKLAVLITDLVDVHAAWLDGGVDLYLTPTDEVDQHLRRAGLGAAATRQVGLPVHPDFGRAPSSAAIARAALGLDASKFTALVHGGGEGAGGVGRMVSDLDASGLPIQIIAVCGRNARARRRLESQAFTQTVHVQGFVNNMASLMAASDVVVTKAGSVAIAETLAVRRPLVIAGAVPGQERSNPGWVRERGVGTLAFRASQVPQAVRRYFEHPDLRADVERRAHRYGRPEAAYTAARVLAEAMEMPEALILRSSQGMR